MTSVANLLTVLGEHFYLVAVACVEILAAVVLAAVFSGKKGLREKITEAKGSEKIFLKASMELAVEEETEKYKALLGSG